MRCQKESSKSFSNLIDYNEKTRSSSFIEVIWKSRIVELFVFGVGIFVRTESVWKNSEREVI